MLNYDSGNRLFSITDDAHLLNAAVPANQLLTMIYAGTPFSLSTVTEYSDPNRLRQISYTTSRFADGTPFLYSVSQIGAAGTAPPVLWQYTYTELYGQPFLTQAGLADPTGQTNGVLKNTIAYDGSGRVQQISDANGNLRQYTYQTATSTLVQVSNAGVLASTWIQNFDSFNRNTGTVDALAHADSVLYGDANNPFQPTSVTNRNGQTSSMTYDPTYGNLLSATAPTNGATLTTQSQYDTTLFPTGPNHPVTFTYGYKSDRAYSYTQPEALGEPLMITDPLGHVSHFRYDSRGNLLWSVDPLGRQTDYQYNDADQLIQIQLPPKAVNSPGRTRTVYTYLYLGGPLIRTDLYDETNTRLRTANYAHGNEGEAKAQTGSVELASQTYDPAYRLKTLTNGNSQAFSHKYDLKGNLTQFAHPRANTGYAGFDTRQGVFDSDDILTQTTDGNNKTIVLAHAPDDSRLTDIFYPAGTLATTHSDYDAYGRVVHVSDNAGDYQYVYDDASNITSVTTLYHGLPAKTLNVTFHPDGSRASLSTPVGTFSYSYDDDGELLNVSFPWNQTLSYTYDAAHRLLSQTQNKFVTSYAYDNLNELLDLNQIVPNATMSLAHFWNMTYDGAGNCQGVNASALGPLNQTSRLNYATYFCLWTYDNRDALTNEHLGATNGYLSQYTANHNYVADAADNLTTIRSNVFDTVNADSQSANLSQNYDGNGNPTDNLQYDLNDRLTNVSLGGGSNVLASYRSDGLRATKTITVNGNVGAPTYFLYDGTRVLCELDASGNVTAAYGYGGAGLAQRYSAGTGLYTAYTFDPMGNVVGRMRRMCLSI